MVGTNIKVSKNTSSVLLLYDEGEERKISITWNYRDS